MHSVTVSTRMSKIFQDRLRLVHQIFSIFQNAVICYTIKVNASIKCKTCKARKFPGLYDFRFTMVNAQSPTTRKGNQMTLVTGLALLQARYSLQSTQARGPYMRVCVQFLLSSTLGFLYFESYPFARFLAVREFGVGTDQYRYY